MKVLSVVVQIGVINTFIWLWSHCCAVSLFGPLGAWLSIEQFLVCLFWFVWTCETFTDFGDVSNWKGRHTDEPL